eukprot:TRINITY_DN12766_c0_g1_i1.p1 TRINITY_DN12766_c0_g1~~TRINITY_DN12766_c0_g1_i1.p1  ORF type:complete len:642 (-),score=62.91 TRINITY_DN12766_c0_g1_i1:369-2294(-)
MALSKIPHTQTAAYGQRQPIIRKNNSNPVALPRPVGHAIRLTSLAGGDAAVSSTSKAVGSTEGPRARDPVHRRQSRSPGKEQKDALHASPKTGYRPFQSSPSNNLKTGSHEPCRSTPVMQYKPVTSSSPWVLSSPGPLSRNVHTSESPTALKNVDHHNGCRTAFPTIPYREIHASDSSQRLPLPHSKDASHVSSKPNHVPSVPQVSSSPRQSVTEQEVSDDHHLNKEELEAAVHKYWEKRRIQTLKRRLVESMEQYFGFDTSFDPSGEPGDFGSTVFDALKQWVRRHGKDGLATDRCVPMDPMSGDPGEGGGLIEQEFIQSLDALGIWPPEMTEVDRTEVFAKLTSFAPDCRRSAVPILSKDIFCQGFSRVPFNLPDFLLPNHLYPPPRLVDRVDVVAREIALVFRKKLVPSVAEFCAVGLISLEEIQVALPVLMPEKTVEKAIMRVIKSTVGKFTTTEWEKLVVSWRVPKDVPQNGVDSSALQASSVSDVTHMSSPQASSLETSQAGPVSSGGVDVDVVGNNSGLAACSNSADQVFAGHEKADADIILEPPRKSTRTAALQTYVIDWKTVKQTGANGSDQTSKPIVLAQSADSIDPEQNSSQSEDGDPIAWISFDMHNEGPGPFLARAFRRCCELYDVSP